MKVARSTLGLASNRLPAVADVLGVPLGRHHQAAYDAEAAAGIAVALMKRQRVATLRELSIRSGVPFGRL
jgi:DNA polymerase-3 subunit epsilon